MEGNRKRVWYPPAGIHLSFLSGDGVSKATSYLLSHPLPTWEVKCKVWPKCWKNSISFVHHNYFPTYTKVAFFLFWHAGRTVALYHNLLLNKRSLAKIISEKVGWVFCQGFILFFNWTLCTYVCVGLCTEQGQWDCDWQAQVLFDYSTGCGLITFLGGERNTYLNKIPVFLLLNWLRLCHSLHHKP